MPRDKSGRLKRLVGTVDSSILGATDRSSSQHLLAGTLLHLRGISPAEERRLWRRGITSWDSYEAHLARQLQLFRELSEHRHHRVLNDSRVALVRGDTSFFAALLPRREHYRIALAFPEDVLFLDIETTGLSLYYDDLTIVGASFGRRYHLYVKGQDPQPLYDLLNRAKVLVTFNGSLFDLPFLRRFLPDVRFPDIHVDLRFLGRRVGLTGPQKEVERLLRIQRRGKIADMQGSAAPLLWYRYERGDLDAFRTLVQYNHADVLGLRAILDECARRLLTLKAHGIPQSLRIRPDFSAVTSRLRFSVGAARPRKGLIPIVRIHRRPSFSYSQLVRAIGKPQPSRIVGIDLTGSETRPSGWAVLAGRSATSTRIASDDELIRKTLESRPTLVSIDSPLSLPTGRLSVFDDDPTRTTAGILRTCERTLRQRGISVYPCLIPSMQTLTARGVRLAARLRGLGLPVIESYPGAAQDIMRIPRKRASLEFLRDGLRAFGLRGPGTSSRVSHDELDAVTSALVGLFFWAGRFEALGDEPEGLLIVPRVDANPAWAGDRLVVGLSGPISAGKTTAARLLESNGFHYTRFSLVLRQLLEAQGVDPTREELQRFGEDIYSGGRQRWLCTQLVQDLPAIGNIVVDGLRHPDDHAFLLERFGPQFLHVHLTAPGELRMQRYISNTLTAEAFHRAEEHPVERNVDTLRGLAQAAVENNIDIFSFQRRILKTILDRH